MATEVEENVFKSPVELPPVAAGLRGTGASGFLSSIGNFV